MNERQRLEELNDFCRSAYRAELEHAGTVRAEEVASKAYSAACDARRSAEAARDKAWGIYRTAFIAFVHDARESDPARASTIGEVLDWFRPRCSRSVDPDDREILPTPDPNQCRLGAS